MAQLFVPITGRFHDLAGLGFNASGENLDRPLWRGAEIGLHDSFPDLLGAVSEAEFREWIIGVRHPLVRGSCPDLLRFLDPDQAMRMIALNQADQSAQDAHRMGARYILFRVCSPEGEGSSAAIHNATRAVFERMSAVSVRQGIQVVMQIEEPCRHFVDGELLERLFEEYPDLSLCLDTVRIGFFARNRQIPPLELFKRWLPWMSVLHLHTGHWDDQGQLQDQIPTNRQDVVSAWPSVNPSADMVQIAVRAHPRCRVVAGHDPRIVSPQAVEDAHAWLAELVGKD